MSPPSADVASFYTHMSTWYRATTQRTEGRARAFVDELCAQLCNGRVAAIADCEQTLAAFSFRHDEVFPAHARTRLPPLIGRLVAAADAQSTAVAECAFASALCKSMAETGAFERLEAAMRRATRLDGLAAQAKACNDLARAEQFITERNALLNSRATLDDY